MEKVQVASPGVVLLIDEYIPKSGSLALMEKWRWTTILFMAKWLETPLDLGYHSFRSGYGSIPINTIFSGMNIHKSQLFWCSPGVQGFDPSPSDFFLIETMPSGHCTGPSETIPCNLTLEKWRVGSDGNSHGCPMYASPVVRFPFLCYIYIYICMYNI